MDAQDLPFATSTNGRAKHPPTRPHHLRPVHDHVHLEPHDHLHLDSHVAVDPDADERRGRPEVAAAFRRFMESLGLDLRDPDVAGTDARVARAYEELLGGLRPETEPRLSTFPNTEKHTGIVSVTGIPFYSLCAHHFLPFFGTADVGYIPEDRLVGLSKIPRVVDHFARRPQLQERLAEQIASHLDERLSPKGVIVVLRARHLCMEMRGVKVEGLTTTVAARGDLEDARLQEQFFARQARP